MQKHSYNVKMTEKCSLIGAVGVKLPAIWETEPKLWFAQAEQQFELSNITADKTKYAHVTVALSTKMATKARAILENPPENDRYEALKKALIGKLEETKEERARKFIRLSGLAGSKPSEIWTEIKSILRDLTLEDLAFANLIEQLPDTSRGSLLAMKTAGVDLEEIVKQADTLVATTTSVAAVEKQAKRKPRFCTFHRKFGNKAYKCIKPCDWVPRGKNSRVNLADKDASGEPAPENE